MRVNKAIVVLASALLLAWGLGASDKGVKIGIVDLDMAITSTDEGRAARDEFERKAREAQAKLQPLGQQLEEGIKELEAKKFVLSEDALFQKQLDLAELRNQIQNMQREIKGQLEVDRERLIAPLRTKLVSIVEELGRDEGFALIMMRASPGLMYTREALDITDLVIDKFNKKS